ncbi:MAG: CBS domain-containing protein [Sphingobium sp.]
MTIAAILQGKGHEVIQLAPDVTLQEAARLLVERRIGCAPVVDGGEVVGILSERDVVRAVSGGDPAALSRSVKSAMTSPAVTITSDLAVITALSLMTKRRIRHLPVIDDGRITGFVSIGDLVKHRIDRIEAEASAMRDYIQNA